MSEKQRQIREKKKGNKVNKLVRAKLIYRPTLKSKVIMWQDVLTLDSHSIPANEMSRRIVTVITPTIRMSLIGSTMATPNSYINTELFTHVEQAKCKIKKM